METWEERKDSTRERIIELEARGKHYDAEFDRLNSAIVGLDRKMENGFDALSKKIDAQQESRRITWPLIFTCVGTLIGLFTIGALLINGALQPLAIGIANNAERQAFYDEKLTEKVNVNMETVRAEIEHVEEKANSKFINVIEAIDDLDDELTRAWLRIQDGENAHQELSVDFAEFKGRTAAESERYREWIRSVEDKM